MGTGGKPMSNGIEPVVSPVFQRSTRSSLPKNFVFTANFFLYFLERLGMKQPGNVRHSDLISYVARKRKA